MDLGGPYNRPRPNEPEPAPRLTEEQIVDIESELTRIAGREIRLPRESFEPQAPQAPPLAQGQERRKRGRPARRSGPVRALP